MLNHIVLLRFRPNTDDAHIDTVVEALRDLPGVIPQIRSYAVNRDSQLHPDNATISVIAAFDDEADWRTYTDHPAHRKVIEEQILPYLENRSATQFRT